MRTQDIPRGVRTQVGDDSGVGIAAASYSHDDPSLFLLGGEGGSLFLCSANPEVCVYLLSCLLKGSTGLHSDLCPYLILSNSFLILCTFSAVTISSFRLF